MGLLLPVLLLGLGQPVDQPQIPASSQPAPQVQAENHSTAKEPSLDPSSAQSLPVQRLRNGRVCYTMRSYIFERHDDLAPEFLGMTTCEPAQASSARQVRHKAKLVPAN